MVISGCVLIVLRSSYRHLAYVKARLSLSRIPSESAHRESPPASLLNRLNEAL